MTQLNGHLLALYFMHCLDVNNLLFVLQAALAFCFSHVCDTYAIHMNVHTSVFCYVILQMCSHTLSFVYIVPCL